ncbi:23345_t:CDS:2 [Cetraspora pellucida]|uniref:23345_t:CDS:1 n=1 Tax=Cetraspora pellucida TaxID=1433469 RepID=A0A9N9N917_9GLOM|nr:23345_t:CDS:2 [Cetraspora pellucida]
MQEYFQTTASSRPKPFEISIVNSSQDKTLRISQTFDVEKIYSNVSAQKKAASSKIDVEKKIKELEAVYNFTTDLQLCHDLYARIINLKSKLKEYEQKLHNLKRNAEYQAKCQSKKIKALEKEQVVIRYDAFGKLSILLQNSELLDHIHNSVEYRLADACRHKEAVASVSHNETKEHIDGHYCLASVKGVRQFAHAFSNVSVIISQDDKAKIGLGIPAVGRTFRTLQSVSEPVQLPDHDFTCGSNQKLIPSVYLIIKPNEESNDLRTGQVVIFVRPQWSIGTSSVIHMKDLISLASNNQYSDALKTNNEIKLIWFLLVDGGSDENPRHFKNIESYCKLFKQFDLDYLTIRTHAPGQSKYNPVERGILTLSGKLAGIVLPIDHFGKHLNSQGNVINTNLAAQNFNYAGTMLCDIWCYDSIFEKHVNATYIDKATDPFVNLEFTFENKKEKEYNKKKQTNKKQNNEKNDISCIFIPWNWIEKHCNLCHFFLPVTKAKDGYYINPVHLLQYSKQLKVPKYNEHCPSIKTMYSRLCCPPGSTESVVEAIVITNAITLEDFSILPSQKNKDYDFLINNSRECFSDIEV